MKLIISGSRSMSGDPQFAWFCERMDFLVSNLRKVHVIVGCKESESRRNIISGVDQMGAKWARMRDHDITYVPADWDKFSRAAGPIRNTAMGKMGKALAAFPGYWKGDDGVGHYSPGTWNMIQTARKLGLQVRITRLR